MKTGLEKTEQNYSHTLELHKTLENTNTRNYNPQLVTLGNTNWEKLIN